MNLAVLGIGNMGGAILKGVQARLGNDVRIIAYDANVKATENLPKDVVVAGPDLWQKQDLLPDTIICAVKPGDVKECLMHAVKGMGSRSNIPLYLSIAAGVNIVTLESYIGYHSRICRVMPNMPALIGEGMSAYSLNAKCSDDDRKNVETIFACCGKTVSVPEKLMNAVTGLSGSGPAYVFLFIEALIEGGVNAGLPLSVARECAVQTVLGAAKMLQDSTVTPAELKARIMSPGGTTARGLMALEQNKFKYAVCKAVEDATKRADELGK
ncbi:MAG: pyrroline-5-carboxylate reductase [Chitinivibrionales bacterium]|nr:pyrroline-5-carboxylate reductase [Chitinivibrionales bacterium]